MLGVIWCACLTLSPGGVKQGHGSSSDVLVLTRKIAFNEGYMYSKRLNIRSPRSCWPASAGWTHAQSCEGPACCGIASAYQPTTIQSTALGSLVVAKRVDGADVREPAVTQMMSQPQRLNMHGNEPPSAPSGVPRVPKVQYFTQSTASDRARVG